jgi:cytoskeleton protein RodZ
MSQPVSEETPKSADPSAVQSPRLSFGSWLRHQREARSVSMREIADNSKISLRYLEALEQDRFDVLPAPVFARGFLREYARVVGLNPDEVVNLYLVALEERAEGTRRVERPKPTRPEKLGGAPSSLGYGLLLGLAVVLFVGIAALLSFLAERRRGAPPESKLVAPVSAAAPAPSAPAGGPLPALAEPQAAAGEGAAGPAAPLANGENAQNDPNTLHGRAAANAPAGPPAAAAGTDPAGAAAPVPEGAAIGNPPSAGTFRVVLNFSQDCWMESVVDGNRRTSELKAAGETVQLEAFQAVVLTLGNSRALTVEVDGVPFALPENSTRVVRDLRIERPVRIVAPPQGPASAPSNPSKPPISSTTPPAAPPVVH